MFNRRELIELLESDTVGTSAVVDKVIRILTDGQHTTATYTSIHKVFKILAKDKGKGVDN